LPFSDRKLSLEFYQGLFGLPVQHRQGVPIGLRIGSGPQYISLAQGGPGAKPAIAHLCMTVEGFSVEGITKALTEHGVTKGDAGPMKTWVRTRGPDAGGAVEGTPELYVGDPDGIAVQFQDVTYCGGAGALGNACKPPEPPAKALVRLRDLSHFTLGVSNTQRSTALYQDLFGMPVQAHQGATPLLAVGSTRQFLAIGGVNGASPGAANIAHGCFTMEGFHPDQVLKALADFGIKPRGDAGGPAGPLVSYVSMRMENRGGAKAGTPELYFTDPDGILIQIQDVSYCGGAGYLGEVCP
jgi:catechol 2,3-dioxygenase-like lactoylglutathione lyase family enzyme